MTSNLSCYELYKYSWRVDKFIQKYKTKEPFELLNGNIIQLKYDSKIEEQIQNREMLSGFVLSSLTDEKFKLSDLKKTFEFGGKSKGFSTRVEDLEIESINKQLEEIKSQTLQISIPLKLNSNVYNVSICSKVNGTPKADFTLSDESGNQQIWISHKKGHNPTHFQQWSGMTEEPIKSNNETKEFVSKVQNNISELKPGDNYACMINNQEVKMQSVYGIDYNVKPFGIQNVTAIIQGGIELIRSDNYFTFKSNIIHYNGEEMIGPYEPVFSVTYRTDRSQFGIKNARFFILPLGGRKIKTFI